MKKGLLRFFSVILVLTVSFIFLTSCVDPPEESVIRDDFEYRNYGIKFDDVNFANTEITSSIAQGEDKIAAALHLITVAENNVIAADYLASASVGDGTASSSLFDMSGALQFGDIYVRDNGKFYSQSVARVTEATTSFPANLLTAAQALLDQSDRKYSADGQTFYVQKVKGTKATARMIKDYPYGTSTFERGELEVFDLDGYKAEEYIRTDYRELSNFVFAEDTIKEDSIEISYDDESGLYTLYFEVDLENEAAREKATEHSRANMREASNSDDLEYAIYNVTIEVYENGLIRKFTREESWEATLNVLGLKPHGSSHSETSVFYSWDPADCTFEVNNIDTSWAKQ